MTRSTLSHGFGGFQRQCIDLCDGFIENGHDVTVITTSHPEKIQKINEKGYDVHFLSPSKPRKLSRAWFKESKKLIQEYMKKNQLI